MRRFKRLLLAGVQTEIAVAGDYFRITAGVSEFEVKPDTSHAMAGVQSGMAFEPEQPFKSLFVLSEVTQAVEIMAGFGKVHDNRTSINGRVDAASNGLSILSSVESAGPAAAEILAQDAGRRSVLIKNMDLAETVYIGVSGVTAADGFPIGPGEALAVDKAPGAALFVVTAGATVELRTFIEGD